MVPEPKVCQMPKEGVDVCKPTPSVVVVGAGIAGLSAAARLAEFGVTDVTVIEATDRLSIIIIEFFIQTETKFVIYEIFIFYFSFIESQIFNFA